MSQFTQKNSEDAQKWADQRKQQIEKAKRIKEERKQQSNALQQNDDLNQQLQSQQKSTSNNNRPPTREEIQQAQQSLQLLKKKISFRKNSISNNKPSENDDFYQENDNQNINQNDMQNYNINKNNGNNKNKQQCNNSSQNNNELYENNENFNNSNNIINSKQIYQQKKQSYDNNQQQFIENDYYKNLNKDPYKQNSNIQKQAEEFMEINQQRKQSLKDNNNNISQQLQKKNLKTALNNPLLNEDNNSNYRKVFKPPIQMNESDLDEQIRSINLDLGAINQTVKNVEQRMGQNKYTNQIKQYFQQESTKDDEINENSYTNSRTSYEDSQDKKGFYGGANFQKNILTTTASPNVYQKPPKLPPNNSNKQMQSQIQKYENTIEKLTSSRKNSLEKFNENQNKLIYNKGFDQEDEKQQYNNNNINKSKQVYQNNINKLQQQSSNKSLQSIGGGYSSTTQTTQNTNAINSNKQSQNSEYSSRQNPKQQQQQQQQQQKSKNNVDEFYQQQQSQKKQKQNENNNQNQNQNQINNEAEYPDENQQLFDCRAGCGRKFNKQALDKHMKVCKQVFQEKRKTFNMQEKRVINDEHQQILQQNSNPYTGAANIKKKNAIKSNKNVGGALKKADKWKNQSLAFRAMLQQARGQELNSQQQKAIQVAAVEQNQLVQCDYCSRKFNEKAAEKHIPFCKNKVQLDAIKKGVKQPPNKKQQSGNRF